MSSWLARLYISHLLTVDRTCLWAKGADTTLNDWIREGFTHGHQLVNLKQFWTPACQWKRRGNTKIPNDTSYFHRLRKMKPGKIRPTGAQKNSEVVPSSCKLSTEDLRLTFLSTRKFVEEPGPPSPPGIMWFPSHFMVNPQQSSVPRHGRTSIWHDSQ